MVSFMMNSIINKTFQTKLEEGTDPGDDPEELSKERDACEVLAKSMQMPRTIKSEKLSIQGIAVEKLIPKKGTAKGTLLYFHGGGYTAYSVATHRCWIGILTSLANVTSFMPEYRLAPENPYPAALEDAFNAYTYLTDEQGMNPGHIVIGGDSAGGGLSMALLLKLKAENRPLPAGGVLFSPWTDLTNCSSSMNANGSKDPLVSKPTLVICTRRYIGNEDPKNPFISPLFGDLAGLPPLQVHVGTREVLMDDSVQLARNITEAGGHIDLHVWDGLIHEFPIFGSIKMIGPLIPECKKANKMAAQFIRQCLTS